MQEQKFFQPSDFLSDETDNEKQYHTQLNVSYRNPLSFLVDTRDHTGTHIVVHNFKEIVKCCCDGCAIWGKICCHMKRGKLVLLRRKKRLEEEKQAQIEKEKRVESFYVEQQIRDKRIEHANLGGRNPFSILK